MIIPCPICGERDAREFSYKGHVSFLDRPAPEAGDEAWDAYLHTRENIAGIVDELWCHEAGCGAWIVVRRNTITHEIIGSWLAKEMKEARRAG
ncbi:MAG: sarcosine oxidase subunit delta [Pseudomonadota bacterium]